MEKHGFEIKLKKKDDPVYIEPIGDIHLGNKLCDKTKLLQVIERIRTDPHRYTLLIGDLTDSIMPHPMENRFDFDTIDPSFMLPHEEEREEEWLASIVDRTYNWLYTQLRPIKDKIIIIHTGNHDDKLRVRHYHDWVADLARRLHVKYGRTRAMTRLFIRHNGKLIWAPVLQTAHGAFSGETAGAQVTKLERIMQGFNADIYLRGHTHQILATKGIQLELSADARDILERYVLLGICGGFLKSYGPGAPSYLDDKDRRPLKVGTITIQIDASSKRLYSHE